jgi:hypothetical protein
MRGILAALTMLIWRLLERTSTMKTRVLLSSIFFMADSVVRGYLDEKCVSGRQNYLLQVHQYARKALAPGNGYAGYAGIPTL